MNYFANLETPLSPEPNFFIEPTDKDRCAEIRRVVAFRQQMRLKFPRARVVAIPNAGKRGQAAINQARSEGAAWGFPDLMVIQGNRIAFFEFKNGKRAPDDHQIDWLNWLAEQGHNVACVRTAECAIELLSKWGWQA